MIRPVLRSLPSTVTSALSAAAYGAIRCGAGIGSQSTSGRSRASFMARTASVNSGGSRRRTRARARLATHDHEVTVGRRPVADVRTRRVELRAFARDRARRAPATAPSCAPPAGSRSTTRPVWYMRQAGRSLPEYLKVREGVGMLESCMNPDLVTEITLQPVRRYGVDAAIFFSDIVLPLKAVGVDLDIMPGVGPVVAAPGAHARGRRGDPRPDARARPVHHRPRSGRWSPSSGPRR